MTEPNMRSARILVDLQACQNSESAGRGAARYSRELFESISTNRGVRDIFCLSSKAFPHPKSLNTIDESRVLRLPELPDWPSERAYRGGEADYLDSLAYTSFIAPLKADVVHVSHVFEKFGARIALPSPALRASGQIYSASLFDLIPPPSGEHGSRPLDYKEWYLPRLAWLQQADLLLAVSESTRQDAIDHFGIEPSRVVTIHSGIAPHFSPGGDLSKEREDLRTRCGLRDRFILCEIDDDDSINVTGTIIGFATIPIEFRENTQLVLAGSVNKNKSERILNTAKSAGLAMPDILILGSLSESDLIKLYRACDLYVFPSLNGRFAFRALDPMACGASVIGSNNSNVRELIVREDALFDANSPASISESIVKVLKDKAFARDLRTHSLKRARNFTWHGTSTLAIAAIDEAMHRSRETGVAAAITGWLPRKRIAVLTPLPPRPSAIAEHNAKFLPLLAKHFDIDLYVDGYAVTDESIVATFRIFDVKDFGLVAQSYDAIVYELGNSQLHQHMLPLLAQFPGIVRLHDPYLGDLMRQRWSAEPERFADEMIAAHGPLANCYFAPVQHCADPDGQAAAELPCTKRVLDTAIGIVSNSPLDLDVGRSFYPEGWRAPYRIIPRSVPPAQELSAAQRVDLRARLGFKENDFIIATFGKMGPTSLTDRILDAFVSSSLCAYRNIHLVCAGELAHDDFGRRLRASISTANLGERIRITGSLEYEDYQCYLRASDVAIRLQSDNLRRTDDGVLDCLAAGLPVIVNGGAGHTGFPDSVAATIDGDPTPELIAKQLEILFDDRDLRTSFSEAGIRYVRDKHDPLRCAAAYAAAIHEFIERDAPLKMEKLVSKFSPHLGGCSDTDAAIAMTLEWLAHIPSPPFARRRLIYDVSHIAKSDHQTGIPRVVKQLSHALYCSAIPGFEPVAVELVDGVLMVASAWLSGQQLLPADKGASHRPASRVHFQPGDIFLMLDSSWARYREFFRAFEEARASRVPIYTVVYDLLPLTLPPGNIVEGGVEWFRGWVRDAATSSDGLVCISKTAADEVIAYLGTVPQLASIPKIGYWHLGSNLPGNQTEPGQPPELTPPVSSPYLLMVGTIEPRKNHELALDAMENLWAQGHELNLCIAGKEGWMVGDLMNRLRTHPLLGEKLFLMEGPTDSEVDALYECAAGLLFLSKGEGFGLPLVEAANHDIPIICSDIPVLREIAEDFATFVAIDDMASLAIEIGNWWIVRNAGGLPDTRDMPRLSWEESAKALMHVVLDHNWMRESVDLSAAT